MSKLNLFIDRLFICMAVVCATCSCSDNDDDTSWSEEASSEATIVIGGIDTDEMSLSGTGTRAVSQDAETVPWLVQPLKNGLDITYGLYDADPNHEDVAILKLDVDASGNIQHETYTDAKGVEQNVAKYTFRYRADRSGQEGVDSDGNAIWYNNGYHYFQGVHVPDRIRYTSSDPKDTEAEGKAPGLTTDQHDDKDTGADSELGNYTLLSHYLGMPANYRLTATVERIKLPFRHRLARVVAFVLIDPELKTTLKGYKKDASGNTVEKEDPNTTSIRFCNVKVLQGVKDVAETSEGDGGHHTLTPRWTTARKVIPHFDGERGSYSYKTMESLAENFLFYYKNSESTQSSELYPTSENWKSVHDAVGHNGYTEIDYGKVPVYDIIVRPTYTNTDNVMYDEEGYTVASSTTKTALANQTNKIDFEIELENGLRYEKEFEFDLNANYQTVVYLRISREHVDYNAAGSDIWVEERNNDGYYGVNNDNGNTLSKAGSSWQRAYTYGYEVSETPGTTSGVTDGQFYDASKPHEEQVNAQYFLYANIDKWVEKFLQAYKGGEHHGDYFILRSDITIDATKIPKDFVFTGHLDGQDHTITLTNVGDRVYKDAESLNELYTKPGSDYEAWTIPTLYVKHVTPAVLWQERELTKEGDEYYELSSLTWVEEVIEHYTQTECDEENNKPEHHPQMADSQGRQPTDPDYEDTRDMSQYVDGYEPWTTSKVKNRIEAHWDTTDGVKHTPGDVKEPEVITYPPATAETLPAYPTNLSQLKNNEYYTDDQGTPFVCPALYQFSHESPASLFYGLDGTYTTRQEATANPYAAGVIWEANVHKETNMSTVWVPTAGYRAEVLNVRMVSPAILFREEAVVTGNVQNCFNSSTPSKETAVTYTPTNIPQYKQ